MPLPRNAYTPDVQDQTDELAQKYARRGYPSAEELIAARGVTFPRYPRELPGDFWPEEESIDGFLSALREWRRHAKTDNILKNRRAALDPTG